MLAKRIIPCLDVKDGRTVKGIQFENISDVGDPAELAAWYAQQGADELVFLDITATHENRRTLTALVRDVAQHVNIPFTVGGGISSVADVELLLENGADKISVNSAAFRNPQLITELASRFGSQCVVVAVDTRFENGNWFVYLNGGRIATPTLTTDWVKTAADAGAGEILLTSMNNDGAKTGFALDITKQVAETVSIPVIASGGAGTMADFVSVFEHAKADAALAASIFHYREIAIPDLKKYLAAHHIPMRIN